MTVALRAGLLAIVATVLAALRRPVGEWLIARTERRLCPVAVPGPYRPSPWAAELHRRLTVVDLHADSLLFGRNLLVRGSRGHVDLPRLVEGNVAIQVFATATKSPRHLNIERNDDRSDDVTFVAMAAGWPVRTWGSLLARAEYHADRLRRFAGDSGGALTIIERSADVDALLARRAAEPTLVGGILAIEGAHALEDDVANLDRIVDAGYRIVGLAHFFDNAFAGSAHGVAKRGLTPAGRDLVSALEARSIVIDLAHASPATIADVAAEAGRPLLVSHTGVRAVADNTRNLTDDQLRAVAATGGLIGIGFWPTAVGGDDAAAIAGAIVHAVNVVGVDHIGLGSDFDGAVPTPFDASGLPLLTEALIARGLDEAAIAAVMGGSAVRFLRASLPA
ncbi:MAG TPA: membrane dipeptidase [Candidatus Limnocylindrales bacterium]|nr:membrane dipeptidase [Candidatus Limnocylindrales bacterium]